MLFFVQKKKSTIWKFIPIVLLAACTVFFGVFSSRLSDDNTKEARARWNAPSHEVSHSAMLLREHTLLT